MRYVVVSSRKGCKNRILVTDLDDIYYDQLKSFLLTEEDAVSHRTQTEITIAEKSALLEASQTETEKLKRKMDELVTMRMAQELTREDFLRHYQPLKDRFSELEVPIEALQTEITVLREQARSSDVVLKKAKDLYSRWPDMVFEEKRSIVETITVHIIVSRDEVIIRLSHLPPHTPPSQNDGTKETNLIETFPRYAAAVQYPC